jgi:glycosyltransferase involved in cell wall biosynthesis
MTLSIDPGAPQAARALPFGAPRRAQAAIQQEAVMPSGEVAVSCSAPLGRGGLGRHLEEIVDALERRNGSSVCICEGQSDASAGTPRRERPAHTLIRAMRPPGRLSPAWRMWRASVEFDLYATRRLPVGAHLIGFNGTSAAQFRAAGRARLASLSLVSANPHYRRVISQHALAYRQYPIERPWSSGLLRRNLSEYARAERIYVSCEYVRESFIEEGFSEERLALFPLTPHPRFTPAQEPSRSATFDIVYMGALTVDKGVPLLVSAVRRLAHSDLRLVLVGGWGTRPMRRFIEAACKLDPRVTVSPGDALGRLRSARLYVHPSYLDGFGYAPAEALACGLPVIVSEDTGMKEVLEQGRNGLVVPTGDLDALTEAIDAAYRSEVLDLAGAGR